MIKNNIRPYEISLWTLQDSFISVLKPINLYNKGQIETPKIIIKNDGTQELSFKIPMYYYENNVLIENPLWYDTKNGILMVNLRKLKVIFNKGDNEKEEVFEFIINKINETHSEGKLYCEVTADGLAFQELGKIGYKISLSEEDFLNDYNSWWEKTEEEKQDLEEPIANLQFWCEKVFKNSKWNYSIQMDWSSFDGVIDTLENSLRESKGLRRTDKIYEEEYIDSWEEKEGILTPKSLTSFKEKARIITIDKSNIYNITQTLAETFGVFCRYKYYYDENYHIKDRECIFYNNFLNEKEGKIDINYPFDSSKIEREMDSTDVITKMFVVPVESESSPSGLITIADVPAHRTKEDYILNFDYLYSIGTITDEQYSAVADYERSMFNYNTKIIPISSQISKLENDLIEFQAQKTLAIEGQTLDKEQMEQAISSMNSITGEDNILEKTESTPYRGVLLLDSSKADNTYYIKISQEGVIQDKDHPIEIFYYQKKSDSSIEKIWLKYNGTYSVDKDKNGNIFRISNLQLKEDTYSNIYYLTFSYRPRLHYENIYNIFSAQLAKDENLEKEAALKIFEIEEKIKKLKKEYNSLIEEKNLIIADFENMMGSALKEGSWQAEEYTDYGNKYQEEIVIGDTLPKSEYLHFIWDEEAFDEEQLNYYNITSNESLIEKKYYPCIDLSNCLSLISNNLENLSIIYDNKTKYLTIGSEIQFGFLKMGEMNYRPVLLVTKESIVDKGENNELDILINSGFLGVITSSVDKNGIHTDIKNLLINEEGKEETIQSLGMWIGLTENVISNIEENSFYKEYNFDKIKNYTFVYPRLLIESLLLKTSEDDFSIKYGDIILKKFYDYSILIREENYYITLNNKFILSKAKINKNLKVLYKLSNAALSIYLDALEVSKTNAFPQVSYTVEVSALNEIFISQAYKMLNRIVNINDKDLKFEEVQGYISELELDLDRFWEDKITIQNYKTKFEDLFSSIVASTEQMKTNSYSYDLAAGAFTSGGTLKPSIIQNTLSTVDLTYAFQSGNLTIDEVNGIWATSDSGVVAMRGGGIFCATQKDSYGNWLWNTGITPSGINASLLRAGQIDTNLIKVYAGDDLRFQLNADGLFAYRQDSAGEANLNEYVVHNSEGLFLTNITDKEKINRVEVSWNGLILRNKEGIDVFYADPNTGNLVIAGGATIEKGSTIAGWIVEDNFLQSKNGNAILCSGAESYDENGNPIPNPYTILLVRGDGAEGDIFKVESDGTLYANNAIIKGTVSAGSIIGNSTVSSLVGAVKKIEIIAFNEDCFRHYNPNLDGIITSDPNWLRFQIKTNGLTKEELTSSNWEFFICNAGGYTLKEALEESTENEVDEDGNIIKATIWEKIDIFNNSSDSNFSFDVDYLTFIIKDGIMINREDLIYLQVKKDGKEIKLNEDGEAEIDNNGSYIYIPKIYQTAIQIRNLDFGTDKFLSLIEPPSYTFVGSQEVPYESTASFTVNLVNINSSDGTWNLATEELESENILIGNSEPEIPISKLESLIAVPEINLDNGLWFIDDVLVQSGDIINADDDIEKISDNGDIIFIDNEPRITIENKDNGDGTGSSTIIIPHEKIPEGGQITLRYTIVDEDNNISASRLAFIFKIKNGTDSFLTHISSSNGTIFRNGATETTLEVELYSGITRLNGEDSTVPYYYVWKEEENGITTICRPREQLKNRFLEINNEHFKNKAIYTCDIYTKYEEAELEYNKAYGENAE